jgi:AraC family L-rhamnose operon regulatory protein RhaS
MTLYSKDYVYNLSIPLFVNLEDTFSEENHSMFRIILVEAGTGILRVNNRSFVFISPSLFCLNERDEVVLEKECDVKAKVIYFKPALINSSFTLENVYTKDCLNQFTSIQDHFYLVPFLYRSEKTSPYFELGLNTFKRISQLYKMIYDETNPCVHKNWVCSSRAFFLEILFLIQYMYTNSQKDNELQLPNSTNDLNEIILYLHTNYQNKITIEDLTKAFHINRTTLSKKFRTSTGMSIKDYLIKLRIKIAALMLRDTMLGISLIMERAGFNEPHHFSRMFNKYMGCSPTNYRKKYCS